MAEAWQQAEALHLDPLPICDSKINGYRTFMVPPDGSKEGWRESEDSDNRRDTFLEWLEEHQDGWLSWAEVQYGDEAGDQRVLRASNRLAVPENER
jgi:hypothetical protein